MVLLLPTCCAGKASAGAALSKEPKMRSPVDPVSSRMWSMVLQVLVPGLHTVSRNTHIRDVDVIARAGLHRNRHHIGVAQ